MNNLKSFIDYFLNHLHLKNVIRNKKDNYIDVKGLNKDKIIILSENIDIYNINTSQIEYSFKKGKGYVRLKIINENLFFIYSLNKIQIYKIFQSNNIIYNHQLLQTIILKDYCIKNLFYIKNIIIICFYSTISIYQFITRTKEYQLQITINDIPSINQIDNNFFELSYLLYNENIIIIVGKDILFFDLINFKLIHQIQNFNLERKKFIEKINKNEIIIITEIGNIYILNFYQKTIIFKKRIKIEIDDILIYSSEKIYLTYGNAIYLFNLKLNNGFLVMIAHKDPIHGLLKLANKKLISFNNKEIVLWKISRKISFLIEFILLSFWIFFNFSVKSITNLVFQKKEKYLGIFDFFCYILIRIFEYYTGYSIIMFSYEFIINLIKKNIHF